MKAFGWRTAPPQDIDPAVVLATNSGCLLSHEAPSRVPDLPGTARSALQMSAFRAGRHYAFAPAVEFRSRASASRILSAPR